jgi:hypothetical protein
MKKFLVLTSIIASLVLQSCDKIDAPYGQAGGDSNPVPTDSIVQKVLLEDLTGFHCTNCPDGHRKAKQLHDTYGDRLIILGVHCSFFSTPGVWGNPLYTYDFRTQAGTEIYNALTPNAPLPKGMVNRVPYPSLIPIEVGNWASAVAIEMAKSPRAGITFDTISYNAPTRAISGSVTVEFVTTITEELSICFFTVEDSIIKPQLDDGIDIVQYNHMHVLRGSLNSTWGQSIGTNNAAGSKKTITFSGNYNPTDAIPENSFVYAILINKATKEVVNVEEAHMIN